MPNPAQFWYLRQHDLFETLSDADITDLCIISNFKEGQKGDMIFFSESESLRLYTIKEGTLKICHHDEGGKEIISEILTVHDIFGHITLDNSTPFISRNEYAQVLSDTISICSFETDRFREVLARNPELSTRYNGYVGEKLLSFQNRYVDLVFKDVSTRVSDFFKRYASHNGRVSGKQAEMEMLLTHQEIADYIAASRQSVTQVINQLEHQGKLMYEGRKRVKIPDLTQL